jgi:hypothetical protein
MGKATIVKWLRNLWIQAGGLVSLQSHLSGTADEDAMSRGHSRVPTSSTTSTTRKLKFPGFVRPLVVRGQSFERETFYPLAALCPCGLGGAPSGKTYRRRRSRTSSICVRR